MAVIASLIFCNSIYSILYPNLLVFAQKSFSFVCTPANTTLTAYKAGIVITTSYITILKNTYCTFILIIVHCSVQLHCFISCDILGFLPLFTYALKKKKHIGIMQIYHISHSELLQQWHKFSVPASCFSGDYSLSSSFKRFLFH